ncbi:MAG TPA: acyl-CoA dehydrogenase family protein [Thermoanaerobaculia bacterium]|jgi:alkylation response protein AidB-like acyl-CoA dehydrogenase|nr:acyl-CoA dehydrogenase family protein [Thermoanaerobaculia bacterium]
MGSNVIDGRADETKSGPPAPQSKPPRPAARKRRPASPASAPGPSAPPAVAVPPRGRLAAGDLSAQSARLTAALAVALSEQDLPAFYRVFRGTELPLLGLTYGTHGRDWRGIYAACFEVLRNLGSVSPAVGLAVYNHYAVTCSLATFPLADRPTLAARRDALVKAIVDGRWLVANTTTRVHVGKVTSYGATARRDGSNYRLSGSAAYLSLATASEIVIAFVQIEGEGFAVFVSRLRDNPQIEVGPYLFPNSMIDSDTRRVTFRDTLVSEENMLMIDRNIAMWQTAWHQALFAVPFLGGAARALDELRKFLRSVRAPNDKPLAELDGMIADAGRMAIRYRGACAIAHQAGQALEALIGRPAKTESYVEAFNLACAAKQIGTRCAEDLVTEVRRIIGARAFTGGQPMERISQETMFAPLGGEPNAYIEREYGRLVLGEERFLSHPW